MNSEYYSTVKKRGFALNNFKVYNKKPTVPAPAPITLSRRFETLREEYSAARKERPGKSRRVDHAVDSDSFKSGQRRFSNHHFKHGAKSSANSSKVCRVSDKSQVGNSDKSQVGNSDKPRNGSFDKSQVGSNMTIMQEHKVKHAAQGRSKGESNEWVEIRFRPLTNPHVEKKANLRIKVDHEGGERRVSEVRKRREKAERRREEEERRERRRRSRSRTTARSREMVRKSPARNGARERGRRSSVERWRRGSCERRVRSPSRTRRRRGPRDKRGRSSSERSRKRRREGEEEIRWSGEKRVRRETPNQHLNPTKPPAVNPPASAGGGTEQPQSPKGRERKNTENEMKSQENLRSAAKRKRPIQEDDDAGVDDETKERMENKRIKNKRRRLVKKERAKMTQVGSKNMCGEPGETERGKKRKAAGGPGRQSRAKVSRTCQTTERNRRFKPALNLVKDILVDLIVKAEEKAKKKMDVMEGDEESNTNPNPHVVLTPEGREGQVADPHLPETASGPKWEKTTKISPEKKKALEVRMTNKPRGVKCNLCGLTVEMQIQLKEHVLSEHGKFIHKRTRRQLKLPRVIADVLNYTHPDDGELEGEEEITYWTAMMRAESKGEENGDEGKHVIQPPDMASPESILEENDRLSREVERLNNLLEYIQDQWDRCRRNYGPSGSGSSSSKIQSRSRKIPDNTKCGEDCKYLESLGECNAKSCRFEHPSHLLRPRPSQGESGGGDTDMSEVEASRPKILLKGNSNRASGSVVQRSLQRSPVRHTRMDQRREIHRAITQVQEH